MTDDTAQRLREIEERYEATRFSSDPAIAFAPRVDVPWLIARVRELEEMQAKRLRAVPKVMAQQAEIDRLRAENERLDNELDRVAGEIQRLRAENEKLQHGVGIDWIAGPALKELTDELDRLRVPCTHCGNPSSHTIYQHGMERHECCRCYVTAGNPPADWHSGCMATYRALHPQSSGRD